MKNERHTKIVEILQEKTVSRVKNLSEELDCSEMTIRRDLDYLESINIVKKEHGCAYLVHKNDNTYLDERINLCKDEKHAIAKEALKMINPNSIICSDSSTTAHSLICILPEDIPLTVITTNLVSAVELTKKENIQILIAGGLVNHRNVSTADYIATDFLNRFNADIAFLSARSFRIPGGAFEHTITLIESKKALISIAKKVVLLLDHTKFTSRSLCLAISLNEIDTIITDDKTPDEYISRIRSIGKEVIVAKSY